jgi:periplasmic protein TonB
MFVSFLLHIAAVLLVILLAPSPVNVVRVREKDRTLRNRILLRPIPAPSKGGGGGSRSPTLPSRGERPRFALRQFTPPVIVPMNAAPKLAIEPTIVLDVKADLNLPSNSLAGLPNGMPGPPSGGPGRRGGIGSGEDGGIGNRDGPGIDGVGKVERLRAGMKPPIVLLKTEPEYSEPARKARVQGTIVVEGVIDERGLTNTLRIRDGLGFGLDEQAIEAVRQWRFRPATRDGKPVAIVGTFYLSFRLL